ncbi:MAG: bifunctional hydroxymethylpyrimidine kinase/phosphomethylpyrimidine kinase [Deltaproteobacteria bacterium]|nr:bifunctional hydroxymethylpyrimidine kinase/phosphomethylpyrimidine kinase [Deltaproteobacteria bacterium]
MIYVLTIAGSDSCGGAGIHADIKTITHFKAHALTAITAVTAQNSIGVTDIHKVPAVFISKQIQAVLDDGLPNAVKVGMLLTKAAVKEVGKILKQYSLSHVVIDPVIRASTGRILLKSDACSLLKHNLFPLAEVITPNLDEAEILTGKKVRTLDEMEMAAREMKQWGPHAVITGGHLKGKCTDLLYDGEEVHLFSNPRIETEHTHGSGCVFSTSLAVFLAMGYHIVEAIQRAHVFTRQAIEKGYPCGQGAGVVSLLS